MHFSREMNIFQLNEASALTSEIEEVENSVMSYPVGCRVVDEEFH